MDRTQKFLRDLVEAQPGGLVGGAREGGGVALAEAVDGEARHRLEDLPGDLGADSPGGAPRDELVVELGHLHP